MPSSVESGERLSWTSEETETAQKIYHMKSIATKQAKIWAQAHVQIPEIHQKKVFIRNPVFGKFDVTLFTHQLPFTPALTSFPNLLIVIQTHPRLMILFPKILKH